MSVKKHIPNAITCCNLFSGCVACVMAFNGRFDLAMLFIVLGAVFDFFDGLVARLLGVSSPLGVQMDSLADDITFGLAPATVIFSFMRGLEYPSSFLADVLPYLAFLIAVFSACRLAKFNIDERQTTSFIGLATPPNAIFWASLVCWLHGMTLPTWAPWVLLAGSLLSCYLLVSEIPFFSFKSAGQSKKHIVIFLVGCTFILGTCATMAITNKQIAIAILGGAICILWYIICNFCTLGHK